MTWSYHFAPYVWPMLASAAFMVALVVYGWPRRDTPGGLPYVLMLIGGVGWALGSALSAAGQHAALRRRRAPVRPARLLPARWRRGVDARHRGEPTPSGACTDAV